MRLYLVFMFLLFQEFVESKHLSTIQFVKEYIHNENKPTNLIYRFCWESQITLKLHEVLSNAGIRSTNALHFYSKDQIHHSMFMLDLGCPFTKEVLSNASSNNLFASPYRWLLLDTADVNRSNTLQDLPLLPDSDFVMATRVNDSFNTSEIYKTSRSGEFIWSTRGYYNGSYYDLRPHKEMYRRRKDLMGHPLTMANVIQDSNTTRHHLEDRLENQHDAIAKISWMVVKLAFEMLNATPEYIFSYRWGYKQNGRWSGMIEDILNNRADLGTNCALYTERLDVIQYTDTIAPFKVGFIFRQPPLSYVANIFSLPFTREVWMAIAGCITFSTITLYLASKWEIRYGRTPAQIDGTVADAMLVSISAFSQQGCTLEPKKTPGRMIVWVVFTALMALYAAYSANIVVLLQAPSSAVRTLTQLSQSKLTLAANDVDYNHFVFGMFTDPVRVEITKKVKLSKGKGNFYEINEGVENIRKGLFAFHSIVEPVYRRVEQTFLEREKCDLVEIDFMMGFDPCVPVKKDSPYLELLRVSFKKIREYGLQTALNKRLQVPKPQCSHKVSAFSSVGLGDLRTVLTLMMWGVLCAIIVLIVEITIYKTTTNGHTSI